jgi:hypothetical protein
MAVAYFIRNFQGISFYFHDIISCLPYQKIFAFFKINFFPPFIAKTETTIQKRFIIRALNRSRPQHIIILYFILKTRSLSV